MPPAEPNEAPPPPAALQAIRRIVGDAGWIDGAAAMERYLVEERGLYHGHCQAVVRPASRDETARVVEICAGAAIPMAPQGGNTGLVGGGVPHGGIVLSTERMNRIRSLDPIERTITCEAGVILADVQAAAAEAGLLFPLSLAAEGSCRIGGNLATNAGGTQVVRYGNARERVLGLEVVLADGRIWNGLRALRKDNAGYDLKQLFIGSEGTLGIITAAVLELVARPRRKVTALVGLAGTEQALSLLTLLRDRLAEAISAFEFINRLGVAFAVRHVPGVIDPLAAAHPGYVLIELTSAREDDPLGDALEAALAAALEEGVIADAVIAASEAQAAALWRLRESIPEGQKPEGASIKNDISVPISQVPTFIARATRAVEAAMPGIRVVAFGHLGDGNIHFNLSQPIGAERAAFLAEWQRFDRLVADIAVDLGGSFTAEHGVGLLKTGDMARYKPPVELDLMRAVKRALDPNDLFNPGKVIDF